MTIGPSKLRLHARLLEAHVLRGIFGFYATSERVQTALEVAEEMHAIAQQRPDTEPLILSHYAIGSNLLYHGKLTRSRYHLEQSIAHYDAQQNTSHSLFKGWADAGVHSRAYLVWVLWVLGYPEQALQLSREAFALAMQLEHPFSVASLSTFIARVYQCCGDVEATLKYARRAMKICSEQGFVYYQTCGTLLSGWALAAQGHTDKGITRMQQGLEDMRSTRVELNLTYFLTLPAGIYARMDRTREALHIVEDASTLVKKNGEHCYESELLRLKGEFLLAFSSDNHDEAESCFHQALDISRHHQARSLELRAATSLARLWQSQDKRKDAYDLLAPVYEWFT